MLNGSFPPVFAAPRFTQGSQIRRASLHWIPPLPTWIGFLMRNLTNEQGEGTNRSCTVQDDDTGLAKLWRGESEAKLVPTKTEQSLTWVGGKKVLSRISFGLESGSVGRNRFLFLLHPMQRSIPSSRHVKQSN